MMRVVLFRFVVHVNFFHNPFNFHGCLHFLDCQCLFDPRAFGFFLFHNNRCRVSNIVVVVVVVVVSTVRGTVVEQSPG